MIRELDGEVDGVYPDVNVRYGGCRRADDSRDECRRFTLEMTPFTIKVDRSSST